MQGINVTKTQEGLLLKVSGNLDQGFPFPEPSILQSEKIIMDFEDMKLINSLGIRNFILFCEALPASKLIYKNCPCILVNQFNMVKSMISPRVKVESFFAPYFAPITHEELEILISPEDVKNGQAPKRTHPHTGEELDFDDLDERYFYFLTLMK